MCMDNYFLLSRSAGELAWFNTRTLTPVIFSVVGVGLRAGLLPSAWPHRAGHIPGWYMPHPVGISCGRALKIEKSLSPSIPLGGGWGVNTNDWCISQLVPTHNFTCTWFLINLYGNKTTHRQDNSPIHGFWDNSLTDFETTHQHSMRQFTDFYNYSKSIDLSMIIIIGNHLQLKPNTIMTLSFLDSYVWANSADPDQTAHREHQK